MEAFGRLISVVCATVGLISCIFFYKTASVSRQRNETVQSMSNAFVQSILCDKTVSTEEWEGFRDELARLGTYQAKLTVFERRRYEGDDGGIYLYTEWDGAEREKMLSEGSYVRIVVTEQEKSKIETFLYGSGCVFFAGGRIA